MSDNPFVPQKPTDSQEDFSVNRLIGIALLVRIVVDTSVQLFFPFLPVIAAGLNVSTVRLGNLLSVRALVGITSPLFGASADRWGYRKILCLQLSFASIGMLLIGSSQSFGMAVLGMVLAGFGGMTFSPTMSAYMSSHLPFERRSRGLGIVEYAWALSGILGLSVLGWLMGVLDWRAPFFVLSFCMFFGAIRVWFLPPATTERSELSAEALLKADEGPAGFSAQIVAFFDIGPNWRSAVSVMISGFFVMLGGMTLLINYGTWFFDQYGLTPAQLGSLAFALGFADICATGLLSMIGDRLGKRNSVLCSSVAGMIAFALLPFFNVGYWPALAGVILARFSFEFGIVANMILSSEQVPEQRGKVMTLSASVVTLSVATASTAGPAVFAQYGVTGISVVAVTSFFFAGCLVWFFANESG